MPPKQGKASGRAKEESKEEILQAVVVADTFETKFATFSTDRPRCLMPLANTPLIEYTLEYLAGSGVQEVFFYAGAHIEQVETYLNASKWMTKAASFELRLRRCMATSVGDIMRDLDQADLIQGDFICVSGDIVSDFPIRKALEAHRLRKEKDKNAIMTICVRERQESDHRHRSQLIPTFVIDPAKERIMHYEESPAGAQYGVHIDPEILKIPELDIRQDLIDCRIDIGTPDMLSLWTENFDNQQPRRDFLYGVLKDHELNGKTIHTYTIGDNYANRVDNPSAYAAITYDLQHGVASSLALTNNVSGTRFKRQRKNILREDDIIIQRPTRLEQGTLVGAGTSIGASTRIRRTVVGRRCQIGKKADIDSAFIWDDVTVGNNVKVQRAIIGSEVFLGDNCTVEEGALIACTCRVPAGTQIRAGQRVTTSTKFGKNTSNYADVVDSDEEDADHDTYWARTFYKRQEYALSVSSLESDASEAESGELSRDGSRSTSFATHGSEEDTGERFVHDTATILTQRMQEKNAAGDMQSELMGLRFSGGADGGQVQRAVAYAIAKHIHLQVDSGEPAQSATRKALESYRILIRRANTEQPVAEQVTFLVDAQADFAKRSDGSKIMPYFVKDLYDLEVFEEEAFTDWYEDERSQEASVSAMREAAKPFIDWLEAAEEEDSDEEDEDD